MKENWYIELSKKKTASCMREIEDLKRHNPFLADLVMKARMDKNEGVYIFGNAEAEAFVRAVKAVPKAIAASNEQELTASTEIFWDIIEFAKGEALGKDDKWNRGVMATFIIFRRIVNARLCSEVFGSDLHSPKHALNHSGFLKILESPFACRDNWYSFIIKDTHEEVPFDYLFKYKSSFLRDAVICSIRREHISISKEKLVDILNGLEVWFGKEGTIMSLDDVTVKRLDAAVTKTLRSKVKAKEKDCRLQFLFGLWRQFLLMDPNRDFFKFSVFWRPETIFDYTTSHYLSKGYRLIPAGRGQKIGPYDYILFTVCATNLKTANGTGYKQIGVRFNEISHIGWKTALVNYADMRIASGHFHFDSCRKFIHWSESVGTHYRNGKIFISRQEMKLFRSYVICDLDIKYESKREYFLSAKKFLRWCGSAGFVELEDRALAVSTPQEKKTESEIPSIPEKRIGAIRKRLDELYEETGNIRYLYTRIIYCLLLHASTRTGEVCAMSVSGISFRPDGSCMVLTREKNTGTGLTEHTYNKIATEYIREALQASKEIRDECPVCSYKDCVFIYRNKYNRGWRVMNVNMFNHFLEEALGNENKIVSGNARHTFISHIKRMSRKMKLNTQTVLAITGHSLIKTVNGYDNIELSDILEATEDINLGIPNRKKEE